MTDNLVFVNFSYKSPHEDVEKCTGYNSDGSINIKYTLNSLKNLFLNNLDIINNLMDRSDKIESIHSIGVDLVSITMNDKNEENILLNKDILYKNTDEDEYESNDESYYQSSDEEETNQERLNRVNNLTNNEQSQIIYEKNQYSEDESGSESDNDSIIEDPKNAIEILKKYNNFAESDDKDTESDESS